MDALTRFQNKVEDSGCGCHEWQSTLHRDGYGKFYLNGKQEKAHRASYVLQVGEIPEGAWVLHKCDNRRCVNPDHLYIGTAKDNARDRTERCKWFGRMKTPFETVEASRRLSEVGMTQQAIAEKLGITQPQVSRYVRQAQRQHR